MNKDYYVDPRGVSHKEIRGTCPHCQRSTTIAFPNDTDGFLEKELKYYKDAHSHVVKMMEEFHEEKHELRVIINKLTTFLNEAKVSTIGEDNYG